MNIYMLGMYLAEQRSEHEHANVDGIVIEH